MKKKTNSQRIKELEEKIIHIVQDLHVVILTLETLKRRMKRKK